MKAEPRSELIERALRHSAHSPASTFFGGSVTLQE
jgi:hypothetical protein